MTTIQAVVSGQVLTATIMPKLACNNRKSVQLNVAFDATWDGYAKSAVFYTSVDPTPYEAVLTNGSCVIPHEVLADRGTLFIFIRGVQSATGAVKSTTPIKYKVQPGTPSLVVSDPSPSVYEQIATKNALLEARLDNLTSLPEGSTTGDAELTDIRIDINGDTHSNAGNAVRKQVAELHGILDGNGITLIESDFEIGSWAAKEGGFYYTNLRIRSASPISKGDVISVKPNGLFVTAIIIPDKSSTTILDTKSYTNSPFEMGCSYDGYVVFIAAYDTVGQVKITPSQLTSEITIYRNNSSTVGRGKVIYPVQYEMGDIFIDNSGFDYNGATTRVRTPEGYTVPLAKGDIIRLTDYTDTRFYVGWVNPDGTYGKKGWLTNDFVCPVDAEYVILVCNTVDTVISSAEVLGSLIEVQTSISNEQISKSFAENQWQSKEISKISKANRNIRSINHRGYNTLAPENTLSAYRISKKMGFDHVECDVCFTSDGVAVLLHDGTIDRTSNGTGNIADMTFEQVRALDFGSWFSESFAGEKIPSFEEFISLCKYANLHPYIELKVGTEDQIKGLVDIVKKHGMLNGVSWISFAVNILQYVKEAYNKARIGYLVNTLDNAAITTAQSLKTGENEVFINSAHGAVTEATAELCANADIPLEVWTVNKKEIILALPSYVSGFSSDSIIANEVFYANYAIDDKAVVIRGGDAVIYPVGLKGKDGKSAYEYAKEGGYKGTEAEFIAQIANIDIQTSLNAGTKLGFGSITAEVLDFDYFVIVNEGSTYFDTYTLDHVQRYPNSHKVYAEGTYTSLEGNVLYCVGVLFTKDENGNYTADVQQKVNDSAWASMNCTDIYGFNYANKGAKGDKGDPGKSAYEYAKDGGYTGTEEEFGIRLAEILNGNSNEPVIYTVTNNLTNVSTSNTATTAEEGSSYTATLTVIGSGMMNNPTVTMGGVTQSDVWTQTGSTKGTINIPSVTGDIVITCGS